MRTLLVRELIGPDGLRFDDVDVPPAPAGGAVRVAVHAAGVGFVDVLLARGRYQVTPDLPFAPGLELSGVVEVAPEGSGFVAGQPVIGHVMPGAFAEVAWVPPRLLAPLPGPLSHVEGAAIVVNHHTALVTLVRRAQLRVGERVLVHGAGGGLGSAMVQVATALGAEVLAVAGSPGRRDLAGDAGASTVYGHDDWFDAVRAAGGADLIVDPVGGEVFDKSVRCLAPEGRLVTVGFASGTSPEPPPTGCCCAMPASSERPGASCSTTTERCSPAPQSSWPTWSTRVCGHSSPSSTTLPTGPPRSARSRSRK